MLPGFELWVPPKSNEYDDGMPIWEILGTEAQIVQFPVRPGRKVMCFSGAWSHVLHEFESQDGGTTRRTRQDLWATGRRRITLPIDFYEQQWHREWIYCHDSRLRAYSVFFFFLLRFYSTVLYDVAVMYYMICFSNDSCNSSLFY